MYVKKIKYQNYWGEKLFRTVLGGIIRNFRMEKGKKSCVSFRSESAQRHSTGLLDLLLARPLQLSARDVPAGGGLGMVPLGAAYLLMDPQHKVCRTALGRAAHAPCDPGPDAGLLTWMGAGLPPAPRQTDALLSPFQAAGQREKHCMLRLWAGSL